MNRIGYCCISLGVNQGRKKKDYISVNRGMTKKTFIEKGLPYVSELVIKNLKDTLTILDWNLSNDIYVYRMSSDSFPWMSEYQFSDLPNYSTILELLISIGDKIKKEGIRVSYHPGPFNVLGSENMDVVNKTILELDKHAQIMDLMGLEVSNYYPINIHINTTKPSREEAASRFCANFSRLSDSCKGRLTIENDDKKSQYSVQMLHELIYQKIGIPIVFDQFHFLHGPEDQTLKEALSLAHSTWSVKPMTHISSSRLLEETDCVKTAHADFIYESIQDFGLEFDTEIEAKAKDMAVIKYRQDFYDIRRT